jgi:hypothetical protein
MASNATFFCPSTFPAVTGVTDSLWETSALDNPWTLSPENQTEVEQGHLCKESHPQRQKQEIHSNQSEGA